MCSRAGGSFDDDMYVIAGVWQVGSLRSMTPVTDDWEGGVVVDSRASVTFFQVASTLSLTSIRYRMFQKR